MSDFAGPRSYVFRHVVCFEETNVVGNVYFARHVAWQGSCREMFLRDNAPGVLAEIEADLRLVTTHVDCDYFQEIQAFDEIELRMVLAEVAANRIMLAFDYRVRRDNAWMSFAVGNQMIRCMRLSDGRLVACPVPIELADALAPYRSSGPPPGHSIANQPDRSTTYQVSESYSSI